MQKKRPWLSLIVAGVIGAAGAPASSASLGGASNSAVLGQTLDFAVPVRLDAGEALAAECVSAEVMAGDRLLPSSQVRTMVEPRATDGVLVRIITTQVIEEPVLTVQLSAGCAARVARRYVVLADPPMPLAGSAVVATAPAFAAAPPEVEAGRPTGAAQAEGAPRASSDATAVPAAVARTVALRDAAPARRQSDGRRTDGRRPAAKTSARRAAAAARIQAPRRTRLASAPPPPPAARLQLDFVEPRVASDNAVEQALQAVAQAASAASAAADRIAALERNLDKLRGDAQGSRDAAADLRERLARAEEANPWIWVLVGFAMVLGGLAAWLAARLLTARQERHEAWLAATAAARRASAAEASAPRQPTSPVPFVSSEIKLPQPTAGSKPRPGPAWPPAAPVSEWPSAAVPAAEVHPVSVLETPAFAPHRPAPRGVATEPVNPPTLPLAQPLPGDNDGPRDVSIDELLDLEQQAEFFVVLGQDDAAIELLVEHLRHTGGGSPLPYLKLLEIYRRRGDRSDYERTRARFNHRFNAYAPEWEVDLQTGRTLQDYPGVIPRLQQVWSRPLDSMAELEALLFRKSRGELFELPAYREVLFLYALARDLLDRESADTGKVDLLLPMADGGDFSSTAPAPYLDLGRDSGFGPLDFEERPTAPVDLDLSHDGDRPSSIFDPLEDPPAHPRRR